MKEIKRQATKNKSKQANKQENYKMKWTMLQRQKRPKLYTLTQTQRQKNAYLALINQTPNQTKPNHTGGVCIHFGVSGGGNGGSHSLTQLLLFYYLNFLHTFLPLFSFFMLLLCARSLLCCHLDRLAFFSILLCVSSPFKCVVFISIMTQWKLIIRDLIALHVLFAELLCGSVSMIWATECHTLIVATHFSYII